MQSFFFGLNYRKGESSPILLLFTYVAEEIVLSKSPQEPCGGRHWCGRYNKLEFWTFNASHCNISPLVDFIQELYNGEILQKALIKFWNFNLLYVQFVINQFRPHLVLEGELLRTTSSTTYIKGKKIGEDSPFLYIYLFLLDLTLRTK